MFSLIRPHKSCTKLGPLPSATPVSVYNIYNSTGCVTSIMPARKLIFATTAITTPIPMLTISATVILPAVLSQRGFSVCTIASTNSARMIKFAKSICFLLSLSHSVIAVGSCCAALPGERVVAAENQLARFQPRAEEYLRPPVPIPEL